MKPYLVKNIKTSTGTLIAESNPTVVRRVISENTSDLVNNLLTAVVTKQGKASFVPGYSIGGKTGTAQKYENGIIAQGKYVSSFFGTYPADDPEYAVLILVDEPGAGVYYGSLVAAPYAKDIFSGIFE
jgi:stage V sporulation protein D (sporulation-specific penicillin-binding protein)